jgi:acetylornithine/succinyldiaminopimelate/putrescine aminotransferase
MPLGAFIADKKIMSQLMDRPVLGHITTFGGHPVCCAAGLASLNVLLGENLFTDVFEKEKVFKKLLVHPKIKSVRSAGLLIAVEFENFDVNKKIIDTCIENGVLIDWFLFAPQCMRIAPPLTLSISEIENACKIILQCCDIK